MISSVSTIRYVITDEAGERFLDFSYGGPVWRTNLSDAGIYATEGGAKDSLELVPSRIWSKFGVPVVRKMKVTYSLEE